MTNTILITGASSGIGREAALRLAKAGHTVFAAARREAALRELAAGAQGTIIPIVLDVRDPQSVRDARDAVAEHAPDGLDVLINNAGYTLIGATETLGGAAVRDQFETNVFGLLDVTQAFLPEMRRRGRGRIVNVSSVAGRVTGVGGGVYSATKYAVEALSDALRMELASYGVSVVLVEPSYTDTDINVTPRPTPGPAADAYREFHEQLSVAANRETSRGVKPQVVAAVIERAATARRPRARYLVPKRSRLLIAALNSMPITMADRLKLRDMAATAR